MQLKNKKLLLILNIFSLLTIVVNDDFWKNLGSLSKGFGGVANLDAIAQISIPFVLYVANVLIIIFAIDSQVRLKRSWLNLNISLNSLAILLFLLAMIAILFVSTSLGMVIGLLATISIISILSVLNLLSLNDYKKAVKEIDSRIGSEGFNDLMATSIFNDVAKMQFLIEKGADVNSVDDKGYTSLMYAASNGSYEACSHLVESFADKEIKSIKGNSALDFAKKNGHNKIVLFLTSKQSN
jgi:hypothetical protein